MTLVSFWFGLVSLVIILYVILDGFSLGVGILFISARNEAQRNVLINSIAPVWDANQTWIVFGATALFAVFPLIYTVVLSALYIPLFTFVFGLIFRGIAFEFRANAQNKRIWEYVFFGGSVIATFAQGVTLGAYINGIEVKNGLFAGSAFDSLTPFSALVGIALLVGYSLLGATYLIIKTEGTVQQRAFHHATIAAWLVVGLMLIVSVSTPMLEPQIWARWSAIPRIYFIISIAIIGLLAFFLLLISLQKHYEILPFIMSLLFFISAYLALQASIYPYAILPAEITLNEAAAQSQSLKFTLWGVGLVLPIVLGYVIYSYSVFRGKVSAQDSYHP